MENLSKMIDAALSEDRDEFLDNFAHEVLDRINERVKAVHRTVSKNLLNPEGVYIEPDLDEEVEEKEVNGTVLRHAISDINFETIDEAKAARKKMMKYGMCE